METQFKKIAMKVSFVSIIVNILLSVGKLLAGLLANSSAMVSDAIHSASDVFSSIIVMIGVKLASKAPDKEHPYGHERLECVAAIILATVLCGTGLMIGYTAIKTVLAGHYTDLKAPGILALIAAIISILVKEAMFWYTKINAQKIDSGALMADAWHHRSDALSSVGALIGIAGARLGLPIFDSIASIIICIFIEKAAYEIFMDAVNKMVDHSCSDEFQKELREYTVNQTGVEGIDLLQTRLFGNKIYVDLEIKVKNDLSVKAGHDIAERVHDSIEQHFPKIKHIMVHVNPED